MNDKEKIEKALRLLDKISKMQNVTHSVMMNSDFVRDHIKELKEILKED